MSTERVRVWVYERISVVVTINDPRCYKYPGRGEIITTHPPAVGDLFDVGGAVYRVLARAWSHPQIGSVAFAAGTGPDLTIVCEAATGLFIDEVEVDE